MTCESIPWDKRDIFHDNPADYPLEDYFPADSMSVAEEQIAEIDATISNGQP